MSVFVDTSALYALLVRTEQGHDQVVESFRSTLDAGRVQITSNYAMVETAALLQSRFGLGPVRDLDSRVLPLLRVVWVTEDIHRKAARRHRKADRRGLSLVDCVSFVIMDALGIREVLALDEDFAREGYTLHPGP